MKCLCPTTDVINKVFALNTDAMIAAWPDQDQAAWDRLVATAPFLAKERMPPDPERRHPALRVMRDFLLFVMVHHNRRALEPIAIIPVISGREAVEAGWPDGHTARAAALCTAALLRQSRHGMTLPDPILVDVRVARPDGVGDWRADRADITSPSDIIDTFRALNSRPAEYELGRKADAETATRGLAPVPIAPLVKSILGIDPALLVRRLRVLWALCPDADTELDDRLVLSGLGNILEIAIARSADVAGRHLTQIRLFGEHDVAAFGLPDADTANMIAVLATALASERHRDITFIAPRDPAGDPRREALLRQLAAYAYWSGLDEAMVALDALCTENMIVSPSIYKRGNDLLQAIRRDEDPEDARFAQLSPELQVRAGWGWEGYRAEAG